MNHKCPKCGKEISDTVKFCPECGTAQKNVKKDKKAESAAKPKKEVKQTRSGMQILYLVALLSIVVTIIYGYRYIVPKSSPDPHANVPATQTPAKTPAFDQEHYGHLLERVRANPDGFAENLDLGNFLFDSQKFEEAIFYYDKAIQANAKAVDVIVDAGVSYFNLNQIAKAKSYFEHALEVDAQHVNALYNMGIVSARLGDMQEMKKFWTRLVEAAPGSEQARNAQQMLEQMRSSN
jgi:cytochrome c-type biogenesis protein CcmH/NrfG